MTRIKKIVDAAATLFIFAILPMFPPLSVKASAMDARELVHRLSEASNSIEALNLLDKNRVPEPELAAALEQYLDRCKAPTGIKIALIISHSSLAKLLDMMADERCRNWAGSLLAEYGTAALPLLKRSLPNPQLGPMASKVIEVIDSGHVPVFFELFALPEPHRDRPRTLLQTGHVGGVTDFAETPDGRHLITLGADHLLKIWDVGSFTVLREIKVESTNVDNNSLVVVPSRGLVVLSTAEQIKAWEIDTGRLAFSVPIQERMQNIAVSPDERYLLGHTGGNAVLGIGLFDLQTRKFTLIDEEGDGRTSRSGADFFNLSFFAQFSPDSKSILFGNRPSGEVPNQVPVISRHDIASGSISPMEPGDLGNPDLVDSVSGRFRILLHNDGVELIDRQHGTSLKRFQTRYPPLSVEFQGDDTILVTAKSADPGQRPQWSQETPEALYIVDTRTHTAHEITTGGLLRKEKGRLFVEVRAAVDRRHYFMQLDKILYFMDLSDNRIVHDIHESISGIQAVAVHPHEPLAGVSFGDDPRIILWDLALGRPRATLRSLSPRTTNIQFALDGKALAVATGSGTIELWDIATGQLMKLWQGDFIQAGVMAADATGRRLLVRGKPVPIEIEGLTRNEILARYGRSILRRDRRPPVTRLGQMLTTPSILSDLTVLDVADGRATTLAGYRFEVTAATFLDGDRKVLLGGNHWFGVWDPADGSLLSWSGVPAEEVFGHRQAKMDAENGKSGSLIVNFKKNAYLGFVERRSDGAVFAVTSRNHIRRIDPATGHIPWNVEYETFALADRATRAALTQDGQTLITAHSDGRLRTWSAETGEMIDRSSPMPTEIHAMDRTRDGALTMSAGVDAVLWIWNREHTEPAIGLAYFADDEWATFTRTGYFISSPEGEEQVSWQFPDGKVFRLHQFAATRRSEEMVRRTLGDPECCQDRNEMTARTSPPTLTLNAPVDPVGLQAELDLGSNRNLDTISVIRNGRLIHREPWKDSPVWVDLSSGPNRLTVFGRDAAGNTTNYIQLSLNGVEAGKQEAVRGNVHFLGIAVDGNGLDFPVKDVHDLAAMLQRSWQMRGRNVAPILLANADVSADSVSARLKQLSELATAEDLVVIHIAGHAHLDRNSGKLLLSAGSGSRPIPLEDLMRAIDGIRAPIVLSIDICHAAQATPDAPGLDPSTLIDFLLTREYSPPITFFATKARAEAIEMLDGTNSLFTKALLNACAGSADISPVDGMVTLQELYRYVRTTVARETGGSQVPYIPHASSLPDLPICPVNPGAL